jgi:SAM-dependent methyltransferase
MEYRDNPPKVNMTDRPASDLINSYADFYRTRDPVHVYPVEFVVRAFLGNYPRLKTDKSAYPGKAVLDLGFGDGRNMPLLRNLGMSVFGVEISDEICQRATSRMARLGIDVTARVGRNCRIPFADAAFDYVLACHSCYYVDPGTRFEHNAREISRVLKSGGCLVFSAPKATSYILRDARDLGDGHMEITNDPYGLRNGSILKKFDRESDIEAALAPAFKDFAIGSCQNDFWGIDEHVWTVVCRKA